MMMVNFFFLRQNSSIISHLLLRRVIVILRGMSVFIVFVFSSTIYDRPSMTIIDGRVSVVVVAIKIILLVTENMCRTTSTIYDDR